MAFGSSPFKVHAKLSEECPLTTVRKGMQLKELSGSPLKQPRAEKD